MRNNDFNMSWGTPNILEQTRQQFSGAPGMGVMQLPGAATPVTQNQGMSFMDRMLGTQHADGSVTSGWGMPALQLGTGLMQGFMGLKQYGLAKDQFKEGKSQFAANYENQRRLTNAELRDRQARRVAENPNATPVDQYMQKNSIKAY